MNTAEPEGTASAPTPEASLTDLIRGIWREIPGLLSDRIELLAAELDRAGLVLLHLVQLGIAMAVLGLSAWLMLWCLAVGGLVLVGLHWLAAIAAGLAVQIALMIWLFLRVKKLVPLLGLPVSRRRLRFSNAPSASPPPDASHPSPTSGQHTESPTHEPTASA
jgi:hypothetical protein